MPLTLAETPLYYKDSQGQYHRVLSGADMTGYRTAAEQDEIDNDLSADIASATSVITGTVTPIVTVNTSAGSFYLKRIGDVVYYMIRFTLVNTTASSNFELCSLPESFLPSNRVICMAFRLWNRNATTMPETLACLINTNGLITANTTGVPDTSTEYLLQGSFPI